MHKAIASKFLQDLCEKLEKDWDADYTEGMLLISTSHGQFLLNYHGVMDQIWLSSPISGAHHFAHKKGLWLCTRSGKDLETILKQDINA